MSLKERTINIDIMTKRYTKLKYKQGDSNQVLNFKLYKNGSELDLAGYVAGIFYEKPNNEVLEKSGTINSNTIRTTITSGVLNTAGVVKAEIFLTKNTEVSISFALLMEVEESINTSSAVQEQEQWDVIRDLLIAGDNTSLLDDSITTTNKTWSSSKIDSQIKKIENAGQPTDEQVSNAINKAIQEGLITSNTGGTAVQPGDTFIIGTGEPTEPTEPTTYTIINNLTNVTNSNNSAQVTENSSYTATLTADNGYTLGTPVITMGGVDITSNAYSNGTITISNVTGNIIITCSANEVFDLSKYLVATGYSVTSKSVTYSVMRFTANSSYNVYSFPVKAGRYKLTATDINSSGAYWLNQAKINAMNTEQLATTTSSVTVTNGVPGELSATFTAASSYEYEGYISIDGGYLCTCYVEFASEGNLIVACNPASNPTIEEVN